MPPALPLGGGVESTAAAAAASAANAAAHAAAAAVMNQPVASVQASTETMEQVGCALFECCVPVAYHLGPNQVVLASTYPRHTNAMCQIKAGKGPVV